MRVGFLSIPVKSLRNEVKPGQTALYSVDRKERAISLPLRSHISGWQSHGLWPLPKAAVHRGGGSVSPAAEYAEV